MVKEIINKVKKIINNLVRPGENLSESVVRGGFWVFSFRVVQQLFNLIRLVILARILAPHDFGLMGIALLTMATLETFSQTGFQQALVQKKEDIKSYLDSAWTVLILRGFILFTILYFIAPYAATFFDAPEATPIIQVIGLSFLLGAFTNIGVIYFQKELEFNKEFIYQFAGTLADFIVAVSAVLILRNVWALVFGLLAGNAVRCFVSYLIHPYRPHLSRDLGKAKELFGFGKWILGSSILVFLLTQGDAIFVGKLLGATALGFYQLAYRISNMPATEITHVISQITFPAYSKLQDDLPKLREAYLKVLQVTVFLSFPIAGLIFVLAPDFTKIFLGEKWMPMVPVMQVLCIFGVIRMINATTSLIFQGIGKPNINTFGSLFQLVIFVAIIYPLTSEWGILGTSIAVIIPNVLFMLYIAKKLINVMNYKLVNFIGSLLLPIAGIVTMCTFMLLFHIWKDGSLLIFLLTAFLGVSVYLIVMYIINKMFNYGLKSNLAQFFKNIISMVKKNNRYTKEGFNPSYIGPRDDIINLVPDSVRKILDVGCSVGSLGEQLKQKFGAEVVGIEVDEQMAKVAKERLDRVILGDLDKINLEDYLPPNYFDCIIFADILEHLKNPWDLLKSATSFLSDEGLIIASIPNIRHYATIINLLFWGYWPYRERGIHDKTHLRFFTLKNIKKLFQYADLKITQLKRNYRIIERPHSYNRFSKYFCFPPFREFLVFQYLIVAKKEEKG